MELTLDFRQGSLDWRSNEDKNKCMTLSKSLNHSGPHFSHLFKNDKKLHNS